MTGSDNCRFYCLIYLLNTGATEYLEVTNAYSQCYITGGNKNSGVKKGELFRFGARDTY